jgi:hypothetical protein
MNFTNRFNESVGECALEQCSHLKVDIWKQDGGNVVASFELHGSIGEWDDDDEDEGGVAEQTDLSLLRDLLERFQRIER